MSKYYTEHFNNLPEWRKVEEALTVIMRVYVSADISESEYATLDIAFNIISDMRRHIAVETVV